MMYPTATIALEELQKSVQITFQLPVYISVYDRQTWLTGEWIPNLIEDKRMIWWRNRKEKREMNCFYFYFRIIFKGSPKTLILECVSETVQDMMVSEAVLSWSTWLLEVLKNSFY